MRAQTPPFPRGIESGEGGNHVDAKWGHGSEVHTYDIKGLRLLFCTTTNEDGQGQ